MRYPGHPIHKQDIDITTVKAIQQKLLYKGCGSLKVDGDYDLDTYYAVMLFQTRSTDRNGNPIKADGIVGPVTWTALFGPDKSYTITKAPNALLCNALDIAKSQVGLTTETKSPDGGTEVFKYHDAVGADHDKSWSMPFIYWCFSQASARLNLPNPVCKSADDIAQWCSSRCKKIPTAEARADISLIKPGQIFIISTGGGQGHSGFVEKNENGLLTTIEGNTSINRVSDSIGVFRRSGRAISTINVGFIEFDKCSC